MTVCYGRKRPLRGEVAAGVAAVPDDGAAAGREERAQLLVERVARRDEIAPDVRHHDDVEPLRRLVLLERRPDEAVAEGGMLQREPAERARRRVYSRVEGGVGGERLVAVVDRPPRSAADVEDAAGGSGICVERLDPLPLTAVPSAGLMSAAVNGSPHRLMLTNWLTLLGKLSRATGDPEKEIRQLQALCDQLERAAFQPLRVGEMGPDFSKRAVDLHYLYNDVIKRLREKKIAGFKGLAAAKFGPNYGRFVHLGDDSKGGIADGAWVGVNYEWGAKHKETPFWVMLGYGYRDPKIDQIRERLDSSAQLGSLLTDVQWGGLDGIHTEHNKRPVSLVPIYLPADVEYNYVLDIVIGQIQRIGDTLATPYPPQSSFRDSPP